MEFHDQTATRCYLTFTFSHNENISTYNDPRNQLDVEYEYAETRIITLIRDSQLGFGFVAGSERPVVVRCVTEGEFELVHTWASKYATCPVLDIEHR